MALKILLFQISIGPLYTRPVLSSLLWGGPQILAWTKNRAQRKIPWMDPRFPSHESWPIISFRVSWKCRQYSSEKKLRIHPYIFPWWPVYSPHQTLRSNAKHWAKNESENYRCAPRRAQLVASDALLKVCTTKVPPNRTSLVQLNSFNNLFYRQKGSSKPRESARVGFSKTYEDAVEQSYQLFWE